MCVVLLDLLRRENLSELINQPMPMTRVQNTRISCTGHHVHMFAHNQLELWHVALLRSEGSTGNVVEPMQR